MLTCFFLCQISTTKQQCVTYVTPFHITATQFPNQNPHELGIWTHREPIKLRGNSEFLFTFFLLCFFLAIVGFGFVGVFFVTGIIGGLFSPLSHCHRVEADLSSLSATWNEQDGKVLWVTKQRGLGFSRFIWNRFLIFGRCTLFKFLASLFVDFGFWECPLKSPIGDSHGESFHTPHKPPGLHMH